MSATDSSPPPGDVLVAACSNCASWRTMPVGPGPVGHATARAPEASGVCTRGLVPPEGEPRCDRYTVGAAFERLIVSRLMRDPTVVPVPLRGRTAREARRRRRRGGA